jgi:hypothetical protein
MSTKIDFVNDTYISVAENMKGKDAASRLILAAACLATLFITPIIPAINLLEILAVYLFSTAIIRWDPVYAIAGIRLNNESSKTNAYSEGSVSINVGRGTNSHAANDSHEPISDVRKAS